MTSNMRVKICGLTRPADVEAAVRGGAAYVGFVFFPKSPRNIDLETARELALAVPPGVGKVALTVDADDAQLDQLLEAVPLDFLQLHGKEAPARVSEIKKRAGLAVIKAVGVASADDLPALETYARVADMLLVDAKPPPDATLPGGNGVSFDWRLIANRRWAVPWMLAGGLSPENVAEAIRLTEAPQVDVSSGVESAPGVKDPQLIAEFLQSAGVAARAF